MELLERQSITGSRKMFSHDHLLMKDVALNPGEEWATSGEGFLLIFQIQGNADFFCGPVPGHLTAGDVLAARHGGKSSIRTIARNEVSLKCLSFHPGQLYPLFASAEIPLLEGILDGFKNPKVYRASGAVAKRCHRALESALSQTGICRRTALLGVAAVALSTELKQARNRPQGYVGMNEHLAAVLEELKAEDILNLSVNELADRFSLSRRHLNRVFHEHFGVSAGTLRMEMRLLRAFSLLRFPDTRVIEVAEKSGFHHLGLFNACFKRRFGLNPSQCRKQTRECPVRLAELLQTDAHCAFRVAGLCAWNEPTKTQREAER